MRTRKTFALALLLLGALGSGVAWVIGTHAQAGADERPALNLVARLNEKSKAAKGGREEALHDLADEVFKTVGLNEAPAGMLDAVKDRLVRAEISYRDGKDEGIPETNVVKVINGLALGLKAPEYAKTSRYEVRKLRVSALSALPNFIADGQHPKKVGASISEKMSPMEAAFVTTLLLRQKLSNPEYQVTHAERLSKWAEKHGAKKNDKANGWKAADATAREEEMEKVIAKGVSELSPLALLNAPSRALDVLGVKE